MKAMRLLELAERHDGGMPDVHCYIEALEEAREIIMDETPSKGCWPCGSREGHTPDCIVPGLIEADPTA